MVSIRLKISIASFAWRKRDRLILIKLIAIIELTYELNKLTKERHAVYAIITFSLANQALLHEKMDIDVIWTVSGRVWCVS